MSMRGYGFLQVQVGGPEEQAFLEVPEPVPGPGELLVRVRAAGVNPGDWRMREGFYATALGALYGDLADDGVDPSRPAIAGVEVPGVNQAAARAVMVAVPVSALVAGTSPIATGEPVVWCTVVVTAPAVVRRDGRVQAAGRPCDHARLGVLDRVTNLGQH